MFPVPQSLPIYFNSSRTQDDQSMPSIDSLHEKVPLEILDQIKEKIENIDDPKEKLAYWQAYTIPTRDGQPFNSVALELSLVQEPIPLRDKKRKINERLEALKIEKQEYQEQMPTLQTEEERKECEKAITEIEKSQRTYTLKLDEIEKERSARQQTILENTPELRASALKLPPLLNTQNAETFANRYAQVACYLQQLEEYSLALQGFQRFIASKTYTKDSRPSLSQVNQTQREILESWFNTISFEIRNFDEELASVRGFFLKDPQGPGQTGKGSRINKNLGTALRALAEASIKEVGTVLKNDLGPQLRRDFARGYVNELFYNALTQYLAIIPETTAMPIFPILEDLIYNCWDSISDSHKSVILKQVLLYSSDKASKLAVLSISKQSFKNKISILIENQKLKHDVVLGILKDILDDIKSRKNTKFLNDFYNYFYLFSEKRLKAKINDITKLLIDVNDLDLRIFSNSYGRDNITKGSQAKIIKLSEEYIKISHDRAINPIFIGLSSILELFGNDERVEVINLIKKYLPRASRKEEIFSIIIEGWERLLQKQQHLIVDVLAPYLNISDHPEEEVPRTLELLTRNWKPLPKKDQVTVIAWLDKYLYKHHSSKLLEAIQCNLQELKGEAKDNASKLLKQYNSKQNLNQPMSKLKIA